MRTMRWLGPLALLALAACARPAGQTNVPAANAASNAAAPPSGQPDPKLAQIFTPDIIGANVTYLETITGPAFSSEGPDRTYKVDGCEVIVGATKGKIDNIGIGNYSPVCSFPIAQYFAGGYTPPVPNLPTFGDIQKSMGGDYSVDCLRLCGNAAPPMVTLLYQGSHADNFNNLLAEIPITEEPALTAYADWGDRLAAKYGDDYVSSGKYRQGDMLSDVAAKDFAPIRPASIRVGMNLPGGS